MKPSFCLSLMMTVITCGCSGSDSPTVSAPPAQSSSPGSTAWRLDAEPADATPVGTARESAKDKDEVTLVGIIGGSAEPFVEGLAAFTIVDPQVPYCQPDEGCPTPWDYCCTQDQVKTNIATVKVVDDSGSPVATDARQLLDVKELATVVVQGTAQRDDAGNLTVAATKVFVRAEQ